MADRAVLLVGATGLLGTALAPALRSARMEVIRHGSAVPADLNADLSDDDAASRVLDRVKPSAVINLAAITDVDRCEREPEEAYRVNVRVAENVARWVRRNPGTRMIQMSTDQVYEGPGPHRETDVKLVNIYAFSKYCAETAAAAAGATILRTNFFGHVPGRRKSFSDWVAEGLRSAGPVRLVTDVLFTPLHIATLSSLVARVLATPEPGTFNLGSRAGMSKHEFALHVARTLSLSTQGIRPVLVEELNLTARRPKDMRMDVTLFEHTFGIRLPELESEIALLKNAS